MLIFFWWLLHKELEGSILDRQKSFGNLTKHLMFYLRAFKHSWTQMSFSTCMIYEAWLILFFCTDLPWFFFTGVLYKLTCEDLLVIRNQTWACSPSADLNRIEILDVLKMFPGLQLVLQYVQQVHRLWRMSMTWSWCPVAIHRSWIKRGKHIAYNC